MYVLGDWRKNKKKEVKLDGIGGINILVKRVRTDPVGYHLISGFTPVLALIRFSNGDNLTDTLGINFPCYDFGNQADTEGFAVMAERAGYQVVGLPNYVAWHIDTEDKEGNLKGNRAQIEAKEAEEREKAQAQ